MLKLLTCIALVFGLFAPESRADDLHGTVRVVDGDTLDIGGVRVRLHGIDAPELGQPCADPAGKSRDCGVWVTRQVRDRWEGAESRCQTRDRDRYGRIVARCFVEDADLARRMVADGLAFAYRTYSDDYVAEERTALLGNRGLHGYRLQKPVAYRRLTRVIASNAPMEGCRIKGNIGAGGERIYHLPEQAFYHRTSIRFEQGERWFCSPSQARAAGWRAARR